ncbi:molybdenum cofactor guanylyltransferase [Sphingomonas sp.]|uniref:molybdenum cofactor guanylyltransferase n=1 Tax=Sphingomonas sp. TaxID=28214 RepID=UPI002DB5D44F|nr:molybdenum cofactor guanylyltransferase [Sphingomonas sp.]HEU4968946.1 molybdenum cofactor guanylyltransferase [Sphingomonas sp.]
MRVLGAVLAGGRSSRFGSDKALAVWRGKPLLAHAADALVAQCGAVVIVGRDVAGFTCVPDWPAPDRGPLGGLAGALNHALTNGYELVLTCGVDSVGLPADLLRQLQPAPAFVVTQPVLGLWPAEAAGLVEEILFGGGSHSMRAFADRIGARPVKLAAEPANVNAPEDLARLELHHGL